MLQAGSLITRHRPGDLRIETVRHIQWQANRMTRAVHHLAPDQTIRVRHTQFGIQLETKYRPEEHNPVIATTFHQAKRQVINPAQRAFGGSF
ncbi:hypothetical protein D3C75_882000 [compost metagenome]